MSVSFVKVMWFLLPYTELYVISSWGKNQVRFRVKQKCTAELYFLMSHMSHAMRGKCLACSKKLKLLFPLHLFVARFEIAKQKEWNFFYILLFSIRQMLLHNRLMLLHNRLMCHLNQLHNSLIKATHWERKLQSHRSQRLFTSHSRLHHRSKVKLSIIFVLRFSVIHRWLYLGGVNRRGDTKWPPTDCKQQSDLDNEARRRIALGPAFRPKRVNKVVRTFF